MTEEEKKELNYDEKTFLGIEGPKIWNGQVWKDTSYQTHIVTFAYQFTKDEHRRALYHVLAGPYTTRYYGTMFQVHTVEGGDEPRLFTEDELLEEFKDWTAAKGQQYANWDRAFASHLRRQAKRKADRGTAGEQRPLACRPEWTAPSRLPPTNEAAS